MRTRAVILSTLASAAALGSGWAAWAVPHAAQATAASATTAAASSPSATAAPSGSASVTATPTATASPSQSATASPSQAAAAATTAPYGGYTGTVTGDAVSMRYGIVQVEVTLSSGTITEVTVLQAPSSGKDMMYTNRAVPVLHDEALSAQSANIAAVSGATFTSGAYIQSLQSALDQL